MMGVRRMQGAGHLALFITFDNHGVLIDLAMIRYLRQQDKYLEYKITVILLY